MRLVGVSHLYHPSVGGNQIHMKELSEQFVRMGHDVTILTSNATRVSEMTNDEFLDTNLARKEVINGVKVRRIQICKKLYQFLFKKVGRSRGGYKLIHGLFNDALRSLAKGPFIPSLIWHLLVCKPDVVYLFNVYNSHSYFVYLARKIFRFKLLIIPSTRFDIQETYGRLVSQILNISDRIIALTEYEKEKLIHLGIDPEKISVIGCGVNPNDFYSLNGHNFRVKHHLTTEPIVTFVGRKIAGKGVDVLIEAMNDVWPQFPQARLVLAGKRRESYVPVLQEKFDNVSKENLDKIIQVDEFDHEQKNEIYDACDIFVMASGIDTFGIVYLEAWICGKPIIACRNLAPATIMKDGEDSILVDYDDEKQLGEAIVRLIKNKSLRQSMGEAGRNKVFNNFTWEIIARKTEKEIERICAK